MFPVLGRVAYLNAGSVGPLSERTVRAMRVAESAELERGRGAMSVWDELAAEELELRQKVGALIGVPGDLIVMTSSTTEGCNIVITGLRLGPGDEVVTTDAEHPGLSMPLLASGATIKQARVLERPSSEALPAILDEVTSRTRLIALSHVLWLNGHVLPLAEIKRATGVPLLVDGAQSAGAIRVDASAADWYTVSGQKWLCGPETTGALYVAEPDALRPQIQSGAAHAYTDVRRLRLLHLARPLMAGLSAAIGDLPEWGFDRAAALVARCRQALLGPGAEVRTEAGQGTLVSFRVPGDPVETVRAAEDQDIVIRNLPDGWLRASVGWWNDESDIDRLVDFLTALPSSA